jgi:hypothetical protein
MKKNQKPKKTNINIITQSKIVIGLNKQLTEQEKSSHTKAAMRMDDSFEGV